jgi:large subunit ribosomal protein L21
MATAEFAVIQTGGKQYPVTKGDVITIEKMTGDFKVGDSVTFNEVLLSNNGKGVTVGAPFISKAAVKGTITQIGRAQKIMVVHYRQKNRSGWKRNGHRQPFFKVKIDSLA